MPGAVTSRLCVRGGSLSPRRWQGMASVSTLRFPTHPPGREEPSVVRPASPGGCARRVPERGWGGGLATDVGGGREGGGDAERGRGVDTRGSGAPGRHFRLASAAQSHLTPPACPRCPPAESQSSFSARRRRAPFPETARPVGVRKDSLPSSWLRCLQISASTP